MNITSYKMSMIWGALMLVMGLLYACPDVDSSNVSIAMPALKAGDITYDKYRITQGTAGTATPFSSTITDFSTLKFSLKSISEHTGEQTLPTITKDGIITTTTQTSAGSYRVSITPDDSTFSSTSLTVDFYVTVKVKNTADLDAKLTQAITDYGLTGDFNYIDTSVVTDMSYLFRSGYTPGTGEADSTRTYVEGFNGDISKWDVSTVTDFSNMFRDATMFNQDIGGWTVTAGTDFSYMFNGATAFNRDISGWRVTAGTNFSNMFAGASKFNQNIGGWTVTAGTDFSYMFSNAIMFNQNIGEWEVTAGTNFSGMFWNAEVFNQDIGGWTVTAGTDFSWMFYRAESFNQDVGGWDVSAGTDFSNMFAVASRFNQDLSRWRVDSTAITSNMFTGSRMLTIPSWYTTASSSVPTLKAGDIIYDKDSIAQGTAGTATLSSSTIDDLSILTFSIISLSTYVGTGTQELPTIAKNGNIITTATTSAGSYRVTITPDGSTFTGNHIVLFYVAVKPADITDLDTKLKQAIADYGLTGDFNYIDTSAVTDMSFLFASGYVAGGEGTKDSTRTYVEGFNGDISKWDVSAVTNFRHMFYNAIAFNQNIGDWNVSSGEIFRYMFYNAVAFNQNIGGWNVSSGKLFSYMFARAKVFNQDISGWIVTAGTDFDHMFQGATAFNQDVSSWNLSSQTDNITNMFLNSGVSNSNLPSWYSQ